MRNNMFEIGDKFRTVPLNTHIEHLIKWRRKETDPKVLDEINEELTKCYDEKYQGGF